MTRNWLAWPERIAVTCACCSAVEEVFVDQTPAIGHRALRERLFAMAVSFLGWLLMKDSRGRADWICRRCAAEITDGRDPVFLAAAAQWARWSEVDYSVAAGVRS